ncbi:hypothetical protein TD95_001768 [Thielaviopsis punctulata]|uniref:VPS9 domain-containing protein n=1 Tax=Thielaviopsis punctulata TaxID=72032 RepID=A0A0F4Z8Y9_9PEZI|nr:hypothetical protein TD95_001768 [Thielaviopsis punctulata]
MQPLNPFLAAFFKSSLPDQCSDPNSHVILVPATDFLLSHKETSSASTPDFITSEEFLASHVIKIQTGGVNLSGRDRNDAIQQNIRESRGKPRSYPTINNRSIIIREYSIFTNKGFKHATESKLLHDSIWYADNFDSKQWLIYYISQPLLGTWEQEPIIPAVFREGMGRKLNPRQRSAAARALTASMEASASGADSSKTVSSSSPSAINYNRRKKQIHLFHELLNNFPAVAKHMQPGLERLFNEFRLAFDKPLPPPPSSDDIPDPEPETLFEQAVRRNRANSNASRISMENGPVSSAQVPSGSEHTENALPVTEDYYAEDDEDLMRASLETAISSAIEIFRSVNRQTMAIIHNSTTLVMADIEKLIERYVTENVHFILFPRLCAIKRPYDRVLEAKIRQMVHIDVSQLGITIHGGAKGKHELVTQLGLAIAEFRKISNSMSPHSMLELLLSTMKRATDITESSTTKPGTPGEKPVLTVNADTLVSLLLFVVIRAQVKNLQARLVYIRNFIYFDDVDAGEMGYALSTFEAVLAYLSIDSSGLRRASHRNKELWDAVASGDLEAVRGNMEPSSNNMSSSAHELYHDLVSSRRHSLVSNGAVSKKSSLSGSTGYHPLDDFSGGSNLGHVFPFTNGVENHPDVYDFSSDDDDNQIEEDQIEDTVASPKKVKHVMMDVGSVSSESEFSYRSLGNNESINSALEGDISVERISQTHDANGQSILMMAVQNGQAEVLRYLLSLSEYFPAQVVLADMNIEDTTLLSAAVQLGNADVIDVLLEYFMEFVDSAALVEYCAIQDTKGRSFGHYLIHAPKYINRLASLVPWQQKDCKGQTPLFTICRSYDQANYRNMVADGLYAAQEYQRDGMPLHIEDHMDNRGNTLLHIVHDPQMTLHILTQCDIDVNSVNDRAFTPLMMATKYGRYDTIRVLYAEPRVDIAARELRGLTAVELAKDDEVRNRIDDLALFAMQPGPDQRLTGVVRGFFVEDATIRLVVKSAAPSLTASEGAENRTYTVTTCRRSLSDFETLERLLALENPYSWMPLVGATRSPFQIHSKPSRAVLQDIQTRADWFLRVMLNHPTFSTHEMLWEFFLVPELKLDQMTIRSELKAATLAERIREEMEPVKDVREVESFVDFARDSIRGINHRTRSVTRRINGVVLAASDLSDSTIMFQRALKTAHWLPIHYQAAFHLYVRAMSPTRGNATSTLHSTFLALQDTIDALLKSMDRPVALANQIRVAQRAMERNYNSLGKAPRWPLGIMDEARQRQNDEREAKALKSRDELLNLGRELRHCQQVVAGELAGWQELHAKMVKKAMKDYAAAMILQERERMDGLVRSLRKIRMPPREMLQAQFEKEQQEMMQQQAVDDMSEVDGGEVLQDAGEGSSSASRGRV